MKVLTLREPWASLIKEQIKTIETRSWPTSYRGELYIHAGLTKVSVQDDRIKRLISYLNGKPLMYGMIIAKCNLAECIYIDNTFAKKVYKENPLNYDCGDFGIGRYAWILRNIAPINPIPAIGHLSIWNFPPEN